MLHRPTASFRFLAWITAFVFLAAATAPVLEPGKAVRADPGTSISATTDQATNLIAAHTFVARSHTVSRAWRSVDFYFASVDADRMPNRRADFSNDPPVKMAVGRFSGPTLVGTVELRI